MWGFKENQDINQMETSPELQFGPAVRAAEAWLPVQLLQVSITGAWIWSCMGKAAAGAAALMQSMSLHHWRAECKITLFQKHCRENICSSCSCCPAAVPQGGHCRPLAEQMGMAVTYWEGPPSKRRKEPQLWQQEGQAWMTSGNSASWMSGQLGWMTVMIFPGLKIYYCSF